MWWILWNINQVSQGSLCFSLLWSRPKTFIVSILIFSFLYLCFFLFSIYKLNDSAGIPFCIFGLKSIISTSFTYAVEHLLYLIREAHYISWKFLCTIYFWCCHNVYFFVFEKVILWYTFVLNKFFQYHLSNYFLFYLTRYYDIPRVFKRIIFQWQEDYI